MNMNLSGRASSDRFNMNLGGIHSYMCLYSKFIRIPPRFILILSEEALPDSHTHTQQSL